MYEKMQLKIAKETDRNIFALTFFIFFFCSLIGLTRVLLILVLVLA